MGATPDQARAHRWMASATACTASSWPMTRVCSSDVQVQQLVALGCDELGDGDARPHADDVRNVLLRHLLPQHPLPIAGLRCPQKAQPLQFFMQEMV